MIKKSWEKKTVLPTMDYDPRNFHCTSEASRISMAQSWQHCLRKKFPSIAHTCVPTTHVRFYLMTNLHIQESVVTATGTRDFTLFNGPVGSPIVPLKFCSLFFGEAPMYSPKLCAPPQSSEGAHISESLLQLPYVPKYQCALNAPIHYNEVEAFFFSFAKSAIITYTTKCTYKFLLLCKYCWTSFWWKELLYKF